LDGGVGEGGVDEEGADVGFYDIGQALFVRHQALAFTQTTHVYRVREKTIPWEDF
jgi:hypothetical protein